MAKEILIALTVFIITVGVGIKFVSVSNNEISDNTSDISDSRVELNGGESVSNKTNTSFAQRPSQEFSRRYIHGRFSTCSGEDCPSKEVIDLIADSLGEDLPEITARQEKYESAIQQINENPDQIVPELSKAINKLSLKDEGYRLYIVNLAMQTSSNNNLKLDFVRDYFANSKFESKDGVLSENSESASTAIEYLGKNIKSEADYDEVKRIIEDNISDDVVKNNLLEKLSIFDLNKV